MIGALIQIVIYLLIVGIFWLAANAILGIVPLPEPIKQVVRIILILILCLIVIYALLSLLAVVPSMHLSLMPYR